MKSNKFCFKKIKLVLALTILISAFAFIKLQTLEADQENPNQQLITALINFVEASRNAQQGENIISYLTAVSVINPDVRNLLKVRSDQYMGEHFPMLHKLSRDENFLKLGFGPKTIFPLAIPNQNGYLLGSETLHQYGSEDPDYTYPGNSEYAVGLRVINQPREGIEFETPETFTKKLALTFIQVRPADLLAHEEEEVSYPYSYETYDASKFVIFSDSHIIKEQNSRIITHNFTEEPRIPLLKDLILSVLPDISDFYTDTNENYAHPDFFLLDSIFDDSSHLNDGRYIYSQENLNLVDKPMSTKDSKLSFATHGLFLDPIIFLDHSIPKNQKIMELLMSEFIRTAEAHILFQNNSDEFSMKQLPFTNSCQSSVSN